MILEPKKIKSVTVSTVSPSICHEVMEPDDMLIKGFTNTDLLSFSRVVTVNQVFLPLTLKWPYRQLVV